MWGYLGLLWALIHPSLLSRDTYTWAKIYGTHNAPFFLVGEFDLPRLEKYCVFNLFFVGNGGPLMLECSNVHVFEESSIFENAFSMAL